VTPGYSERIQPLPGTTDRRNAFVTTVRTMNPWAELPASPPFILPDDRPRVLEYQTRSRPENRLAVGCLPEPWVGNPITATVIVLQLNPGYTPSDDDPLHARSDYQALVRASLLHQPLDYPFHYLDPRFANSGGAKWCRRTNRWALEQLGDQVVAARLAHLEWFPYRSTKAGRLPRLASQAYSIDLLREALKRDAVVIATRRIADWEAEVPELVDYPRRLGTASQQQVALSPGNLTRGGSKTPEAFRMFIEALTAPVASGVVPASWPEHRARSGPGRGRGGP